MKRILVTDKAPEAIGPYSQGTILGNLIFLSGQIPINPATGLVVSGGIEAQTKQVFSNIDALLHAAGSDFDHVIKTTVFLKDMDDFNTMNRIYGQYFRAGNYPARSAVQVAKLPKDVQIEIEVIAERRMPTYITV